MASIIQSVTHLFQSMVEVLWSFVATAGQLVEKTFEFVLRSFNELFSLALNFVKGLVDLAGGLASFLLGKSHACEKRSACVREERACVLTGVTGNVVILGVLGAGAFAFLQYQRKQGNTVQVGNKKLN